jgi:hypothetical protein
MNSIVLVNNMKTQGEIDNVVYRFIKTKKDPSWTCIGYLYFESSKYVFTCSNTRKSWAKNDVASEIIDFIEDYKCGECYTNEDFSDREDVDEEKYLKDEEDEEYGDSSKDPEDFPEWKNMNDQEKRDYLNKDIDMFNKSRNINLHTKWKNDSEEYLRSEKYFSEKSKCLKNKKNQVADTYLTIDDNLPLDKVQLSSSLTHLTFGFWFNQPLDNVKLPSSLKSLTFEGIFNQSLDNVVLPDSITHLEFGWEFNQPLEKLLFPDSLTHLTFGDDFNQSLDKVYLPYGLTHLTFGNDFNQSLDKVQLPSSLTNLKFGYSFNQSLDNVNLPNLAYTSY